MNEIAPTQNLTNRQEEQVAVMFSGGTDSTLAAAMAAETFKKVHLLTFRTSQMAHAERSRLSSNNLIERYGADKIVHYIIDNDALFRKFYFSQYKRDLRKYGLYLNCLVCPACGVGFQVRSLLYCRTFGCRYIWDGLQSEGTKEHLYPGLQPEVQGILTDLYQDYDVIRESPVYDISRTDYVLYERGITDRRGLKLRALLDADLSDESYQEQLNRWHKTQADCTGNVVGLVYLVCAFLPKHGQAASTKLMTEYFAERVTMAREYLEIHFNQQPLPFLEITPQALISNP